MRIVYTFDDEAACSLTSKQSRAIELLSITTCSVFSTDFHARVGLLWGRWPDQTRMWFQLCYTADGNEYKSRKWFLSHWMTDDEIVKTIWLAFEIAVKHELLEGFKFDGQLVFNPHTPFDALIQASQTEQFRDGDTGKAKDPSKVVDGSADYVVGWEESCK